ncbi:hypothetical protein QYF36_015132 [Acer negundo]|nr:hypothetical protein QYF36_015132 [Acer negundo]
MDQIQPNSYSNKSNLIGKRIRESYPPSISTQSDSQEQGLKVGVAIEFKNVGVEYGDGNKGDEIHVVYGMEQEASEVVTQSKVATTATEEVNDEISADRSLPARRTQ